MSSDEEEVSEDSVSESEYKYKPSDSKYRKNVMKIINKIVSDEESFS